MSRGWSPLGERFGRNLWRTRRRAELTQQELADLVGMHRGPLGELERGLSLPRLDTIPKLTAGTSVSRCVLLEGMEWRPGRYVDGDFHMTTLRPRSACAERLYGTDEADDGESDEPPPPRGPCG
jgi:transcriptional regulator with XRE-family HTH domain